MLYNLGGYTFFCIAWLADLQPSLLICIKGSVICDILNTHVLISHISHEKADGATFDSDQPGLPESSTMSYNRPFLDHPCTNKKTAEIRMGYLCAINIPFIIDCAYRRGCLSLAMTLCSVLHIIHEGTEEEARLEIGWKAKRLHLSSILQSSNAAFLKRRVILGHRPVSVASPTWLNLMSS